MSTNKGVFFNQMKKPRFSHSERVYRELREIYQQERETLGMIELRDNLDVLSNMLEECITNEEKERTLDLIFDYEIEIERRINLLVAFLAHKIRKGTV